MGWPGPIHRFLAAAAGEMLGAKWAASLRFINGKELREPRVVSRTTHEAALASCSLADLKRFAVDLA